ncbi:ribonuclease H-like protein, partial [Clavulina sp. PMI_390]
MGEAFCVYSDGSSIEGGVGAAAVALAGQRGLRNGLTLSYTLGADNLHTVYEAELIGAILALEIIRKAKDVRSAAILMDNQSAIRTLQNPTARPGQQLTQCFFKILEGLLKTNPRLQLQLVWVPGHRDIEGNEAAD